MEITKHFFFFYEFLTLTILDDLNDVNFNSSVERSHCVKSMED